MHPNNEGAISPLASQPVTVVDRSWLRPGFLPLCNASLTLIPRWLPANFITLLGLTASLSTIAFAFTLPVYGYLQCSLQIACLTLYTLLDHLDGMHAKYTKTASELGHLSDHFLDYFSSCAIILSGHHILNVTPVSAATLLTLNSMAFASANFEERKRRVFYFGRVGTIEGISILACYYVLSILVDVLDWDSSILTPAAQCVTTFALIGFAASSAGSLTRSKSLPRPLLCDLALMTTGLLAAHTSNAGPQLLFAIPVLTGSVTTARLVLENATTRQRPWPAPLAELILAALSLVAAKCGAPQLAHLGIASASSVLALRLIKLLNDARFELGHQWHWRNTTT